jgi:hypothetical protein
VSNIKFILSLKNINYLDVSNYRENNQLNIYRNPSCLLAKIVFYLKNLQSLDVSGTNLGGADMFNLKEEIEYIKRKLEEEIIDFDDFSEEEFKRERLQFLNNISYRNCNESKISGLFVFKYILLLFYSGEIKIIKITFFMSKSIVFYVKKCMLIYYFSHLKEY